MQVRPPQLAASKRKLETAGSVTGTICFAACVRNRTHRHRLFKRSTEPDFTGVLKNRPLLIRLGKTGRLTTFKIK
jgi:hypothetical protein